MKYADYYKQMHNQNKFKGWDSSRNTNYQEKNLNHIYAAMKVTRSKSLLDFGCGTGEQYTKGNVHRKMGVKQEDLYLYDPGVDRFSKRPDEIVDATISFDVMEHIPREELPEVLQYIFSHTRKFCYFVIFCGLARKTLPNGENAHCTIMSQENWKLFIEQYNVNDIPIMYTFRIPTDPAYNILNL